MRMLSPQQKLPDYLRILFLTEFTEELIKNSINVKISIPKRKVVSPKMQLSVQPQQQIVRAMPEPLNIPAGERIIQKVAVPQREIPTILRIPEQRLPEAFNYLRPYPTSIEIDLGKINPLIKDVNVRIIECNGPDDPLVVTGNMGRKFTNITINQEEINEVIKNFAEKSKIPATVGTYRVVVGRLMFMAIISEIISPKFVIKKLVQY